MDLFYFWPESAVITVISDRTKKALAKKRKLGFTLGSPANLTPDAIESGRQVRQSNARADENNRRAVALFT